MFRLRWPALLALAALYICSWTQALALVLLSLLAHEWAHTVVAKSYGAKTERMGLSVFGFVARVRRMDTLHPRQRALVYLSGPTVNILLAAWAYTVHHLSYIGVFWLRDLAFYNAVLAGFNLLPFLPLDGGRLFQLFLGNRLGILRANRLLLLVGRVAAVLVILLGFVQITLFHFNATLLCAGIFLWRKQKNLRVGLRMECFLTLQKKPAVLRGQRGRGRFKVKPLAVPVDMPVLKAVERLTWSHVKDFTIDGQSLREEKLLAFIFSPDRPSISASLTMPIGAVI